MRPFLTPHLSNFCFRNHSAHVHSDTCFQRWLISFTFWDIFVPRPSKLSNLFRRLFLYNQKESNCWHSIPGHLEIPSFSELLSKYGKRNSISFSNFHFTSLVAACPLFYVFFWHCNNSSLTYSKLFLKHPLKKYIILYRVSRKEKLNWMQNKLKIANTIK